MNAAAFPVTSRATLLHDPAAVLAHLRVGLQADNRLFEDRGHEIFVDTGIGGVTLRAEGEMLSCHIAAPDDNALFVLRQMLMGQLDSVAPGLAERLAWDGPLPQFARPPNFRLARVVAVSREAGGFVRLRLAGEGLEIMGVGGMHLRLLLPPEGRVPVWPGVDGAGRTVWPTGNDKLHDPVYTVRSIDPDGGWLDIDVFVHGRGRTCHWAPRALGDEVGLIGPGGGGLPQARHLLMAGDETALPAIARILETAAPSTEGLALIEVRDATMIQPLRHPAAVRIHWCIRGSGAALDLQVLDHLASLGPGGFLWFAAEKRSAGKLRTEVRTRALLPRDRTYIASYWEA